MQKLVFIQNNVCMHSLVKQKTTTKLTFSYIHGKRRLIM